MFSYHFRWLNYAYWADFSNFVPFFVQSNPKKDIEGNNKPIINNQI